MKEELKLFVDFFKNADSRIKLLAYAGFAIQIVFGIVVFAIPENQRLYCFIINSILIVVYILFLYKLLYKSVYQTSKMYQSNSRETENKNNGLRSSTNGGIINYFPSRADAIPEISKQIKIGKSEIFISGISLSSIDIIFRDDSVAEKVAQNLLLNKNYNFYLIILHPNSGEIFNIRDIEIETRDLYKVNARTMEIFRLFKIKIEENVEDNKKVLKRLHLKYYYNIMPRHFILRSDNYLSIGSYFSHKEGGSSYLLTLKNDSEESLHKLFNKEVDYIKKKSQNIDIDKSISKE